MRMKKIFKWTLFAVATFEFSGLWYWCSTDQFSKQRLKERKAQHLTVK